MSHAESLHAIRCSSSPRWQVTCSYVVLRAVKSKYSSGAYLIQIPPTYTQLHARSGSKLSKP